VPDTHPGQDGCARQPRLSRDALVRRSEFRVDPLELIALDHLEQVFRAPKVGSGGLELARAFWRVDQQTQVHELLELGQARNGGGLSGQAILILQASD
jgi:hypothetical protein